VPDRRVRWPCQGPLRASTRSLVKCVHHTSDRTLAQLLRGALESEGIAAIVQGEHLTSLQGQTPAGASAEYRVCIVDDEQLPRAAALAKQWIEERVPGAPAPWVCEVCGERHEPHFASCWNCGADPGA
jgi:hypothetical protein